MASVNSHSWKKSASFESLKSSVYTLAGAHSAADLVSLISGELPHDTGEAFQEATLDTQHISDSVIVISNLDPVAFLAHTGKEVAINDPVDLAARSEGITFLRFNCTVDASTIDGRVTQVNPLSFQFCIKLL